MRIPPAPFISSTRRERRLQAARLAGACAVAVVAQVLVDMPGGYFGRADEITVFGAVYVALCTGTLAALLAPWPRPPRWAGWTVSVLLAANVGVFIAPLVADPFVAGVAAGWNLWVLATFLFPAVSRGERLLVPAKGAELGAWLAEWSPAVVHLAAVSLVLTAAVVGHRLSHRWLPLLICLALNLGTLAIAGRFLLLLFRDRRRSGLVVVALPLVSALFFLDRPAVVFGHLAAAQVLLLVQLLGQTRTAAEVMQDFFSRPARLVLASFVILILVGTALLTFPAAAADGVAISPLDALFTATSAACVTGLIVLDTPHAFSPLGHGVLLGLIQVGGLGIMVLSTFAALALGGSLGLRGEQVLRQSLEARSSSSAYRLTRFIVLSTLATEALGALALAHGFSRAGAPAGRALWLGLFHSVSAFCNAGFALQSDSLIPFQHDPASLAVVAALIVLGGAGFGVLLALGTGLFRRRVRWPVQVRVVVVSSAALVLLGWVLYAAFEWNHSLAALTPGDKLVNAFFQSVTTRTAGFNSVDLGAITPAALLLVAALMFVGASPGGTGGGIRTTTAAVVLAAVKATMRGGAPVVLYDREVPRATVDRSLAIAVLSALTVSGGVLLLALTEAQPLDRLFFEVVSAVGTVGLSLGVTPELGVAGKLIVTVLMLAGRVGPLTLALVIGSAEARSPLHRHPRTSIMVG